VANHLKTILTTEITELTEEKSWKNGILEYWNAGGKKCLNPLFHHSNIPIHLLCVLCGLCGSIFLEWRGR
jgi:hypothetical protein